MTLWRRLGASLLAAIVLAAPALAQKQGDQPPYPEFVMGQFPFTESTFGGMDVYKDSAHLGHSEATSAINVLTEHGYVEKRPGSVLASNFPSTIESMVGFVTQGGSWILVAHSSAALYETNFGLPPVFIATVTAGQPVSFLSAFDTLIAVDGFTETEYNGVSTTTSQGFPECQYLEFAQQRVWCAKVNNVSTSLVYISSVGSQGYWTIPPDPTIVPNAPNLFYINYQDGQPITCMKNTPWGMVVGKERSMWIIKGYDNTNWYIQNVDPSIGCVDNRSMQMVDGRLEFGSIDGIYSWTGAGPLQLESLPVDPLYQTARQSTAQQEVWTTQQQQDWEGGVLTVSGAGAPMSATEDPGNLIPSSFTFVNQSTSDFAAGALTNVSTSTYYGLSLSTVQLNWNWTVDEVGGGYTLYPTSASLIGTNPLPVVIVSTYTQNFGTFTFITSGSQAANTASDYFFYLTGNSITSHFLSSGGYFLKNANGNVFGTSGFYKGSLMSGTQLLAIAVPSTPTRWDVYRDASGNFSISENYVNVGSFSDTTYGTPAYIGAECDGTGSNCNFEFDSWRFPSTTGSFTSAAFNTTLSTPTWGNLNVIVSSGALASQGSSTISFQTETSADGVSWSGAQNATPLSQVPSPQTQYIRYLAALTAPTTGPASVLNVPSIQNVTILAATTGYYYSPVHFVGSDISSWATFDVGIENDQTSSITGDSLTGTSTITYQIREATFAFIPTAALPAWTNQQPNTLIGLSVSTPTYVQFGGNLQFSNAEIAPTWNLASVNWNTGSATAPAASAFLNHRYFLCLAINGANNDTCLVQQRTRDWVEFTGQSIGAFTLYNGTLEGGSGLNDGSVWREMQDGVYNDAGVPIDASWTSGDLMLGDPVGQKVVDEIWLDAIPSTMTQLNVNYAVDRSTTYVSKPLDLGASPSDINLRVMMDSRFALGKYFRLQFENAQDAYFRVNAFTIWGRYKPRTD